jgi:hypothetical protein
MATDIKLPDRKFTYRDARVRQLVDEQKPAPRGLHFLVIKTNSEGRPCAWAKGSEFTDAVEHAERMWENHGEVVDGTGKRSGCCYPGETVGEYQVHIVSDAPLRGLS